MKIAHHVVTTAYLTSSVTFYECICVPILILDMLMKPHYIRKNLLQVQQVDQRCFALEIRFER